jgi:Flp pilus assembly CpaE family ATPase
MGPDQATTIGCDVLLIDDVCSFLTPRLITSLKTNGVEVIGVYAPEDGSDAKRHLLECGISDVIETEATPEEFLQKVAQTLAHRIVPVPDDVPSVSPLSICVTGPSAGVGVTEVAISLARAISETTPTSLLDLDPEWPSVAQRLGLPVHPNIRTALDHAFHTPDRLQSATLEVDGGLTVVGGPADGGTGAPISRHDILTLLDAMGDLSDVVVADIGPIAQAEKGLLREFDTVLVVGRGDPVGIARLIKTLARLIESHPDTSLLAVVNCLERGSFRRSEIVAELDRAFPGLPVATLPFDARLGRAAWDGSLDEGPRHRKAVASMSDVVVKSLR